VAEQKTNWKIFNHPQNPNEARVPKPEKTAIRPNYFGDITELN
jgi:hypothetical protein